MISPICFINLAMWNSGRSNANAPQRDIDERHRLRSLQFVIDGKNYRRFKFGFRLHWIKAIMAQPVAGLPILKTITGGSLTDQRKLSL
jgi:hypothetical protein